jgi:uncharacterized membrane protein YfcA
MAAVVLVAAFIKGAIGFGFPSLATPLLSLVVDVKTAVVLLILPNIVMDGIQFARAGPPWPPCGGSAPSCSRAGSASCSARGC